MLFKLKQLYSNSLYQKLVVISLVLLFIALYFSTENILYPLILVVPVVLAFALVEYKVLLYLMLLTLPFSIGLRLDSFNLSIGLPSEPLIGILAVLAVIFILFQDRKFGILSHGMTFLLYLYWGALVLSFGGSTMYLVSIKSLLVATAFLLVFYYLIAYFLYTGKSIASVFLLYGSSLLLVVLYTTGKHYDYGFNKNYSGTVVEPFYSDHTIYGACIAFMVPIMGMLYYKSSVFKLSYIQKILAGISLVCFLFAVYFSHSRATWISLACALALGLLVKLKISFKYLMIGLGLCLLFVFLNLEMVMPVLIKNKYDSKAKRANLEEQIRSVTNIKNDVSNVERVNRWLCAVRMFNEKPITGYGVGTFQFKYIPFQKGSEMTEISITSPKNNLKQGMGGTAHSEYLLAFSESGFFAGLALLLMPFYVLYLGMKLYYNYKDERKYYALMLLLSLLTYFVHGIFNNFLTTDKAAFLVWSGMAALTVLDIQYEKQLKADAHG